MRTIIGWPAPTKQNTGAAHGAALGEDEIRKTKEILGFDPDVHFAVDAEVLAHARQVVDRGREAHAKWQVEFDGWAAGNSERVALLDRLRTRSLPAGWTDKLPSFPTEKDGKPNAISTRSASGKVLGALADTLPELWGGSADLAESNTDHDGGRAELHPGRAPDQDVARRTVRTHPAFRHPRTRDGFDPQRHHPARRHPGLRRHVPRVQRLHASAGSAWPR